MAVSEMQKIGYEEGMEDMHNYVINMITNAMNNPALDVLTPRQVLGILIASLKDREED
jgi:type I restriction-modification system DNA methylase subunit